jgi:hypothetical protein
LVIACSRFSRRAEDFGALKRLYDQTAKHNQCSVASHGNLLLFAAAAEPRHSTQVALVYSVG